MKDHESKPQDFAQALQESERLRQFSLRLALIGHWRIDLATGALTGTDELYQIFELPLNSPLDAFDRIVHPDDRESLNRMMQLTLQSGGSCDSSYRLHTSSGKQKWVHAIGEGVFDADGKLVQLVGAVQDITAFRRVEDELQKMQRLESLGVLAGGIAHDFNNILTALFGNLSLARSRLDPGHPAHADLGAAEHAMQRATNLSRQLLTFAKGGDPVKTRLDLQRLLRDIARLDLAGSSVGLELQAEPGLWTVEGDQGQLEQMFGNLVINARQAMPQGGVLHVQLANVELAEDERPPLEAGNYLRIRLQDEGEGISAANLARVFDPYFSTRPNGSGLGLATAWSIVNRHHGLIQVQSSLGEGACFTLYLPATAEAAARSADNERPRQLGGSGRILVMDDEADIRDLLRRILMLQGYEVEVAPDGTQAIARYQAALQRGQRFDCVIMDLTIPGGMGGMDALRALRALDPQVVALVSSGYAEDPIMANPAAYGFKGVLPKPFTRDGLLRALQGVLGA